MNIEILYPSTNTAAKFTLEAGEEITAESGSMIAMNDSLSVETTTHKETLAVVEFFRA